MYATISMLLLTVTPRGAEQLANLETLSGAAFDEAVDRASRAHTVNRVAAPRLKVPIGERGEVSQGARVPYRGADGAVREAEAELRIAVTPTVVDEALRGAFEFTWNRPDFRGNKHEPAWMVVEAKDTVPLDGAWKLVVSPPPPTRGILQRPPRHAETVWLFLSGVLASS